MARITVDENLKGKDLYSFLRANKSELIAQKKSMIKHTEAVCFKSLPLSAATKESALKTIVGDIPADATTIKVKVVANTSMFCDSAMDVLLRDSAKKSIKDRKGMIPFLHDHVHELEAEIGDVKAIYYEDIALRQLGWDKAGTGQGLIFEADIQKEYNPRIFNKYKAGKVNQHSIGLQYVKIELAINDEEDEKEKDFYDKYIDQIINKEFVEERGYFWVVSEYKLLENSAVLFGANELTPTLEVSEKSTQDQPPTSTEKEPPFDLNTAIKQTRFFN